jgi:adenine-specific DNA-methyltransferase
VTDQPQGRLELTWANKGMRLLAHADETYEWVEPQDWRVAETRLLRETGVVGEPSDNLLVTGDALHFLRAVTRIPEMRDRYQGQVRLCYIDPPFNTGQAFAHYDDALENSVWLTMLRDRLVQIRELLAPDGSVWVHLDDAQQHRARMVLDEAMGPENFVATVVWQKIHARNNSAQHFSSDHDFIHVYARSLARFRVNRVDRTEASDADFWNPDNDPRGDWRRSDLTASKPYADGHYEVTGPHGDTFSPRQGRTWGVSAATFEALQADNRLWWGRTGRTFPFRKRFRSELGGLVPTTVWVNEEVGNNREAKQEITRLFGRNAIFATPKPERLIRQVLSIGTDPGDLVLDCFAGSGTTAAVAHKMGRCWITSELLADTVEQFAKPRLERVVAGTDRGGITRAVGWTGGGGFTTAEVAPSMFEDAGGVVVLAEWATGGALAEAVAAQVGYRVETDPPFCGRRGRSRLAVIDGVLSEDVARLLVQRLDEHETLLVVAQAIEAGVADLVRDLRPGSRARKVPRDLAHVSRTTGPIVTLAATEPTGQTRMPL